jgi:hypothetical protein
MTKSNNTSFVMPISKALPILILSNIKGEKETNKDISNIDIKLSDTILEVFSNNYVNEMVKLILDDPIFITKVENSIKSIVKDNKVNQSDIPEFVFLIMEAYNSLPKAKLTKEEIPEFISCVYNYLVEKYNLIPKEERSKYESLIVSSIKLVLMNPQLENLSNCKFHCLIC